jgi:histidyl-tRNA synthetase
MASAPRLVDRLADEDREHFEEVRDGLDGAGVDYVVDGTLVRGLDYYTRTVFEITCDRLGAQSGIGGGGRYDGLIELLGGNPTPGCGWAAGIERIVLALELGEQPLSVDVFVAVAGEGSRAEALALAIELRRAGVSADLDLAERGMKGQMKAADRLGAAHCVIIEGDGAMSLRDMARGDQRAIPRHEIVSALLG